MAAAHARRNAQSWISFAVILVFCWEMNFITCLYFAWCQQDLNYSFCRCPVSRHRDALNSSQKPVCTSAVALENYAAFLWDENIRCHMLSWLQGNFENAHGVTKISYVCFAKICCCRQQTLRARISSLIRALWFYRFSQTVSPVERSNLISFNLFDVSTFLCKNGSHI